MLGTFDWLDILTYLLTFISFYMKKNITKTLLSVLILVAFILFAAASSAAKEAAASLPEDSEEYKVANAAFRVGEVGAFIYQEAMKNDQRHRGQ